MGIVNISGMDKAEILQALYNRAKKSPDHLHDYNPVNMTLEEARLLIEKKQSFDFLYGRVMKINLGVDNVDTWGYNRDNGFNAADNIIDSLRKESNVSDSSDENDEDERFRRFIMSNITGLSEEEIKRIADTISTKEAHNKGLFCSRCQHLSNCTLDIALRTKGVPEETIQKLAKLQELGEILETIAVMEFFSRALGISDDSLDDDDDDDDFDDDDFDFDFGNDGGDDGDKKSSEFDGDLGDYKLDQIPEVGQDPKPSDTATDSTDQ